MLHLSRIARLSLGHICVVFAIGAPASAQRIPRSGSRISTSIDERSRVVRQGDRHPLARAEFDAGVAAPETRLERMLLVLQPDAAAQRELDTLLAAQHDPQSPSYHQWLTPEEFGFRFGISEDDLLTVVAWLQSHGFDVEPVEASRRSLVFSGSAAQVDSAFHTEIHNYRVNGTPHQANATDPEIPSALAPVVRGVASLHDFRSRPMHLALTPAYTTSTGGHYLSPADFNAIYDLAPLASASTDGTGQFIAVIGRTNIKLADVQNFRGSFGLATNNPTVVLNGADPGIVSADEQGEATLDVEWAGAVAPKAGIQFVVSKSTSSSDGVTLSAQYAVNHNLAPVISLSFGLCEASMGTSGNQFWNSLWQQAAAQGISVLVASGDSGAAGCDSPSASTGSSGKGINGLCSSPYSTCVGGTQFADTAKPTSYWSSSNTSTYSSALGYIPESAWNESAAVPGGTGLWGTGGGASRVYTKPAWQTGPGVPADGARDVPDVSLTAAGHDGYLIQMNGGFYSVGGTSAATPAFAGLMALAAQRAAGRLGNANPVLYSLAARQGAGGAAIFHDIISGNNSVPGVSAFTAGAGYDLATGLGTVDAAQLVGHWNDVATPVGSFQLAASLTALPVAQGATATTTVQIVPSGGFASDVTLSASGLPTGLTASFSPSKLPAGATTSTLSLSAGAQAPAGTYSFSIAGAGGGITRTLPAVASITCTYLVSPISTSVPASGGTLSITIATGAGCGWSASTSVSWITLTATSAAGKGSATLGIPVAANPNQDSRSATLTIAGQPVTVSQPGLSCTFTLTPTTASPGASAGAYSAKVTALSGCHWTALSDHDWLTISSGASGNGNGTVNYAVAANAIAVSRAGNLTIAGRTLAITQTAAPLTVSLSSASASVATGGGTGTVAVTLNSPSATWKATSTVTWLSITAGAAGTGNGTVAWTAAANPASTARAGTLNIAGLVFTLTQPGVACTYSAGTPTTILQTTGTLLSFPVTAPAGCKWTASSSSSWVTLASGSPGSGNGAAVFNVAPNTTKAARTATVNIAGITAKIVQGP